MHIIETPAYRKAFIQYLRKGTAIELSLKAMTEKHPTRHYSVFAFQELQEIEAKCTKVHEPMVDA